jgi:sterol desaturase/sphingolipid hydroxylase (fatty acid hydroxylase superfamily)
VKPAVLAFGETELGSDAQPQTPKSLPGGAWIGRFGAVVGLALYAALLAAGWWATNHILPDTLTLRLAGRALVLHNVHDRIVSNAMTMLFILPLALWIEWITVGWARSSVRQMLFDRTNSIRTDIAFFLVSQAHLSDLVGKLMMLGASMISGLWIRNWMAAHLGFTIDAPAWPEALLVVLYFYAYTFFDYWTHRIDHSPWFWPLHRYHHAAEDFCVLTGGRAHPAAFVAVFVINLPLAVLGAPPTVMLYVNVAVTTLGFLIHSNIQSDWGWVGRWLVQSPAHHRLHHKLDMTYPTSQFSMAPIWDRLFGTWGKAPTPGLVIGVAAPYRHGFWIVPDLVRDYLDFWRALAGWRRDA